MSMLACSTTAMKLTRSTDQVIDEVNLLAVRFFRPSYPVAGVDDFSQMTPGLLCELPSQVWSEILAPEKAKLLIACVNSLKATANYIYVPQTEPVLAVDPLAHKPDLCIYHLLATLPLPREIYFLATTKSRSQQDVYSMSFDTKANQIEDMILRSPRFETKLRFPLKTKLQTVQDLNLWLTTVVFSLFRDEKKELHASLVTENLEKSCFQNDPLFSDKKSEKIPAVFWH